MFVLGVFVGVLLALTGTVSRYWQIHSDGLYLRGSTSQY